MTNRKCLLYETLNNVQSMSVNESLENNKKVIRLSGVFGVCGVKNNNNRVYNKQNYGMMVEALQRQILESGCPGELEHPNSMNITLENVSHKIESIQMNQDGTITGTIRLLDTPKGKIAQSIVEGGLPLYISSRGAGSIDANGNVTLTTIKTYDLVGTPGFSQAKLSLAEGQTLECLNESAEDGTGSVWAIISEDDLLDDSSDDNNSKDKESDDKSSGDKETDEKKKTEKDSDDKASDDDKSGEKKDDKKEKNNKKVDMTEIFNAIKSLEDKVTNLEAELHIAKESLVNYDAIEKWVVEEFGTDFKEQILEDVEDTFDDKISDQLNEWTENIAAGVQSWVCEEFAPEVQNWVCEEFAPEVQNWVCEEFAPEVQNWVCEEFAPEVQNWVCEEFAPEVQNWICEEFAPEVQNWICEEYSGELQNWICEEFGGTLEGWITEEFAPEHKSEIVDEVNENVNEFFESQKDDKLNAIDKLLESIDSADDTHVVEALNTQQNNKFAGVYVVENMPNEYRPTWQMLDESRQNEIIRSSRMYDFTKPGVLESFWATNMKSEKFENSTANATPLNESSSYADIIASRMRALRLQ